MRGRGTVKTVEALETLEASQLVDKQGGGLFRRLTLLSLVPTNHSCPECGSGGGDWPLWARCTAALLRRLFFVPAAPHTHCLTIVVVVVRPPASNHDIATAVAAYRQQQYPELPPKACCTRLFRSHERASCRQAPALPTAAPATPTFVRLLRPRLRLSTSHPTRSDRTEVYAQ